MLLPQKEAINQVQRMKSLLHQTQPRLARRTWQSHLISPLRVMRWVLVAHYI